MRLIGHVAEEADARNFGDYLYVQGIENQLDYEKAGGWGIWINDEDKVDEAEKLLTEFITDFTALPFDPASLPEIRHGELWRLITPMFIHFGIWHLLLNMLWLRDLGSMIEARQSPLHLAILVVVFAAGSNLGQILMSKW